MTQQQRPQWEQDLSQYERDGLELDRERKRQNARDNPAIMERLDAIEAAIRALKDKSHDTNPQSGSLY